MNGQVLNLTDTVLTKAQVCNYVYPVGSIYINYKDNTNPNTLLGCGTWELVPRDYYIRSADSNGATNYQSLKSVSLGGLLQDVALPNIKGVGHYGDNNNEFSGALYNVKNGNLIGDGGATGTLLGFDASRSSSVYTNNANGTTSTVTSSTTVEDEFSENSNIPPDEYCRYYVCMDSYDATLSSATASYMYGTGDGWIHVTCTCKYTKQITKPSYAQSWSFNVLVWKRKS